MLPIKVLLPLTRILDDPVELIILALLPDITKDCNVIEVCRSSTALFRYKVLLLLPRVPPLANTKVPPLTVVSPPYALTPDNVIEPACPDPLMIKVLVADPSVMTPSYIRLTVADAARPPFDELSEILRKGLRVRLLSACKVPPANTIVPAV